MDDAQLLARVTMAELIKFRAPQFPEAFVDPNPRIFLNSDWVHPAQLRAFLINTGSTLTVPVKAESIDASGSLPGPHAKVEDITGLSLPSPVARPILSSDDESEVEASLWPSDTSSDPPNPHLMYPSRTRFLMTSLRVEPQ
ncbi:hypothetical protein K438DRAFT_1980501 [Mycena galopus ATCC 62051]|nr:hypothetical protein K438DRAFT_1980501 [Mycena galopus ATCC 62051]